MFVRYASLATALAACLALAACNDSTTGPGNATVRFVNAIPDGGAVSFAAQGQTPGTGIAFSAYSACQSIAPGSTTFTVSQSGSGTALVSIPAQQLVGGRDYTIVAVGTAASPSYVVLTDTFTTPAVNRALLRVLNAIPTTTAGVDIFVAAPATPLGTANQTLVYYRNVEPFLNVPAGTAADQVWLTTAGTQTVIATSGALSLANGEAANLIFTGPQSGTSTNVSFLVPTCQ